ncbi:MAG: hypothetical protein ACI9CE_000350 [Flavobacterium sp.]|jgi:hypothetical protein
MNDVEHTIKETMAKVTMAVSILTPRSLISQSLLLLPCGLHLACVETRIDQGD